MLKRNGPRTGFVRTVIIPVHWEYRRQAHRPEIQLTESLSKTGGDARQRLWRRSVIAAQVSQFIFTL